MTTPWYHGNGHIPRRENKDLLRGQPVQAGSGGPPAQVSPHESGPDENEKTLRSAPSGKQQRSQLRLLARSAEVTNYLLLGFSPENIARYLTKAWNISPATAKLYIRRARQLLAGLPHLPDCATARACVVGELAQLLGDSTSSRLPAYWRLLLQSALLLLLRDARGQGEA